MVPEQIDIVQSTRCMQLAISWLDEEMDGIACNISTTLQYKANQEKLISNQQNNYYLQLSLHQQKWR
jgi:hypothetical protein